MHWFAMLASFTTFFEWLMRSQVFFKSWSINMSCFQIKIFITIFIDYMVGRDWWGLWGLWSIFVMHGITQKHSPLQSIHAFTFLGDKITIAIPLPKSPKSFPPHLHPSQGLDLFSRGPFLFFIWFGWLFLFLGWRCKDEIINLTDHKNESGLQNMHFATFLHFWNGRFIAWNKLHACYCPIIHYWELLDCQRVCCNAGNNLARLLT